MIVDMIFLSVNVVSNNSSMAQSLKPISERKYSRMDTSAC